MKIGNRVTEKDVRLWLDEQGWAGRSAKIDQLDLHAIKSPGWIQVFRFIATVRPAIKPDADEDQLDSPPETEPHSTEAQTFFGAVRDDERQKGSQTKIWMFEGQDAQAEKLSELSEGLITLRAGETSTGFLLAVGIFVGLIATVVALVRWYGS